MMPIIHVPHDLLNATAKELYSYKKDIEYSTVEKLWDNLSYDRQKYWKNLAYRFLLLEDD